MSKGRSEQRNRWVGKAGLMILRDATKLFASALYCCLASSSIADAVTYVVTDLGDLPGGADSSDALDVNEQGQVAGVSTSTTGRRGFIWQPSSPNGTTGDLVDLGDLSEGANFSAAFALNDSGQVVGYSGAATGDRAFLWQPTLPNAATGTLIDLGDLPGGGNESYATGINNSGQVVGASRATTGRRGFLWQPVFPNATSGDLVDLGDLRRN